MSGVGTRQRILAKAYLIAKSHLISHGYSEEIDWQYSVCFSRLDEKTFLGELAWVILNSGMRESIIRMKFPFISRAFLGWECSSIILQNRRRCLNEALNYFSHRGKIEAILYACSLVSKNGFPEIKREIEINGVSFLQNFPYIGSTTSWHLAKNIGLPVCKPDRHLVRVAMELGYANVQEMCTEISNITCNPIQIVDIVLWRYAVVFKEHLSWFINYSKKIQLPLSGHIVELPSAHVHIGDMVTV